MKAPNQKNEILRLLRTTFLIIPILLLGTTLFAQNQLVVKKGSRKIVKEIGDKLVYREIKGVDAYGRKTKSKIKGIDFNSGIVILENDDTLNIDSFELMENRYGGAAIGGLIAIIGAGGSVVSLVLTAWFVLWQEWELAFGYLGLAVASGVISVVALTAGAFKLNPKIYKQSTGWEYSIMQK